MALTPEEGEPITVVLCDGHAMVRAGLRLLLEREPNLLVLADTSTAAEAEDAVAALSPTVLVLDLGMPAPNQLAPNQPAPNQPAPHQPAPHQPAPHQPARSSRLRTRSRRS